MKLIQIEQQLDLVAKLRPGSRLDPRHEHAFVAGGPRVPGRVGRQRLVLGNAFKLGGDVDQELGAEALDQLDLAAYRAVVSS